MRPTALKMLMSQSPPVFSHSPPTGFLSEYSSFCFQSDISRIPRGTCRSPSSYSLLSKFPNKLPLSPKKPCLVIRPSEELSHEEDVLSPTRLKKRVVFADDKGMSLTHVRVMTEPSSVPPVWSNRFLSEVTQGITVDPIADKDLWEMTFSQPASDYVEFRKTLDSNKVSLENVIIKESDKLIVGTIKVSNISFEKTVFVRSSTDDWKTHEDSFCTYVINSLQSSVVSAYVLYDTFSFKLPLPAKSKKLEFCVCYRATDQEHWDNNSSKNYAILKKIQPLSRKTLSCNDLYKQKNNGRSEINNNISAKYVDVIQAKLDSWSEFASWTHLENTNPYW